MAASTSLLPYLDVSDDEAAHAVTDERLAVRFFSSLFFLFLSLKRWNAAAVVSGTREQRFSGAAENQAGERRV